METPKFHHKEKKRQKSLEDYQILDSGYENDFDEITRLASEICNVPISLISLIDNDRQWMKSTFGINIQETPRTLSFCAHAINEVALFQIEDARKDVRFHDSPLVMENPNVVFYAGTQLIGKDNLPLGTLCVLDTKPNSLNEFQKNALKTLGKQVIKLFELKRTNILLEEKNEQLKASYEELEKFSHVITHDLKSPLNNITELSILLNEDYAEQLDEAGKVYVNHIQTASEKLKLYIDATLKSYKNVVTSVGEKEHFDLIKKIKNCIKVLDLKGNHQFILPKNSIPLYHHKGAFEQIFMNLISNAIKYNDKEKCVISIFFADYENHYEITVEDNGIGIAKDKLPHIFEMFYHNDQLDRFNNMGTGIGLTTVKSIVDKLNGIISVTSEVGVGSQFKLLFNK